MQIRPLWHSLTHSCPSSSLINDFFPSGMVGPASSLFIKYCLLSSSSLVVQRDPPPLLFFPSGTVGPTSSLVYP